LAFNYEKLLDSFFVRDPDGRTAYYPWGPWSRGYWVDSETRQTALRDATRHYFQILRLLVPAVIIGGALLATFYATKGIALTAMACCGFYVWWIVTVTRLTRGLERAPRPARRANTPRLESAARRLSLTELCFCLVGSLYFAVAVTQTLIEKGSDPFRISLTPILWALVAFVAVVFGTKLWKRVPTDERNPERQYMNSVFNPVVFLLLLLLAVSLIGALMGSQEPL